MFIDHFDFAVPLLWTIDGLMSAAECAALLAGAREAEWLPATINGAAGRVVDAQVRNNSTCIVRDAELAQRLFTRMLPRLPQVMSDRFGGRAQRRRPAGLFVPLRIYRYEPGQHFGLHHDQSYQDGQGRRSLLTFLLYLDEGCEGGETVFPEQQQTIVPQVGRALLFQHMLLHSGEAVRRGLKHVLRSDVLFEPIDP